VWVDSRALKAMNDNAAAARSKVGTTADAINAGITSGTVFFKPAHVPQRFITDAITNVIQGSLPHAKANYNLWQQLSDRDRLRALAAAGVHGYQAMPHEGDFVTARMARAGSNFFAKYVDSGFRANSLLYEARKAGFANTPQDFVSFLDKLESRGRGMDPAEWAKVDWVAKHADRAAIAYDRLSPGEKRVATRAIWFYPWLKGSAGFVGHTIVEHPFKAAALTALGKQGEAAQQQAFGGPGPSYTYGNVPWTGGPTPLVNDFSSWMPVSGATSALETVARPPEVLNNVLPVIAAGLALAHTPPGRNPKTPLSNVLGQLIGMLPESRLFLPQPKSKSPPLYPGSPFQKFLHSFGSPVAPRRMNLTKYRKDYQSEINPRG
jgi:hypothetical protein